MDEFERAVGQLRQVLEGLSDDVYLSVSAPEADPEWRTIQGIVRHVVQAGYAHANYLRLALSVPGSRVEVPLGSRLESLDQLETMTAYLESTLDGHWNMSDDDMEAVEIKAVWGTLYDLEQMLEHAVVHVLRHRRQIERRLLEMNFRDGV